MDDYCKKFEGGYCERTNMHVPLSWCKDRCRYGKNLVKGKKPKKKGPTVAQMTVHFTRAMSKWVKKGFPVCTKEEYIRRGEACKKCSGGWRCPVCGCQLWAKRALLTEECPRGLW